jgi:hypothetical protein
MIYKAWLICKSLTPVEGYEYCNDVVLGLSQGTGAGDIKIGSAFANFVVGREYRISISEVP